MYFKGQGGNPEFQSALVRLAIWLFMLLFIGLGSYSEYYEVPLEQYYTLFVVFFLAFSALFVSVLIRPVWPARQYVGLVVDIAGVSYSIILSQNAISPIYLLYIWIFISYGTRYGREHLIAATVASLAAYSAVITELNGWQDFAFEAYFFLLFMGLLPIYQYSLLKKLHAARTEAVAANRARGRFLASMTHEIRTPLSGVIGMARLMEDDNFNDLQKDQMKAIKHSANKLELLVGDILDFSRIDAEKLELQTESFDLAESVLQICQILSIQAAEKRLELYLDIDPLFPAKLKGDPLRLSQIVTNLVSNSIKFTDRGHVAVKLGISQSHCGQDLLDFQVSDTGIGIAEENLSMVFDPFRQADQSSSRRHGGVGLGMAISKNLAKLMKGDIQVSSQPGEGTQFTFRMPIEDAVNAEVFAVPELKVLVIEPDAQVEKQLQTIFSMTPVKATYMNKIQQMLDLPEAADFDLVIIGETAQYAVDMPRMVKLLQRSLMKPPEVIFLSYPGDHLISLPDRVRMLGRPLTYASLMSLLQKIYAKQLASTHEAVEIIAALPVAKKKILVAEDDLVSGKLISALLTAQGHDFRLVKDGYSALAAVRRDNFDMAFIDLCMPGMDGIEFVTRLRRENGVLANLPVFALTANACEETRRECLRAGMNRFLIKPIDPMIMQDVIQQFA